MKNIDTYQKGCLTVESKPEVLIENGKQAIALSKVLGEIVKVGGDADKLKKHLYYKKPEPTIEAMVSCADDEWAALRNLPPKVVRLLHCVLGIQSELEEVVEPLMAHLFDGKPLDDINVMEELGDIAWYLSIGLDAAGFPFSEALHRNRVKLLEKRYKKGFTNEAANVRDLDSERTALETAKDTANSECLLVAELLAHDSLRELNIDKQNNTVSIFLEGSEIGETLQVADGKTLNDVLAEVHSALSDCEDHQLKSS